MCGGASRRRGRIWVERDDGESSYTWSIYALCTLHITFPPVTINIVAFFGSISTPEVQPPAEKLSRNSTTEIGPFVIVYRNIRVHTCDTTHIGAKIDLKQNTRNILNGIFIILQRTVPIWMDAELSGTRSGASGPEAVRKEGTEGSNCFGSVEEANNFHGEMSTHNSYFLPKSRRLNEVDLDGRRPQTRA